MHTLEVNMTQMFSFWKGTDLVCTFFFESDNMNHIWKYVFAIE